MMQGKGLYVPQGLTLRAVGDHSPRACASMVADFGLSAAGAPGAWRRSSSGARARNAAGTAARVLFLHAWSERSAERAGTAERPQLPASGYLRPFQSTWPRPRGEGAYRWAPPAGRSAHRADGARSGLWARAPPYEGLRSAVPSLFCVFGVFLVNTFIDTHFI